jgi:hypothetical protein
MQHDRTPRRAPAVDLTQPEPELLEDVPGDLFGPNLSIKGCFSTPDVGVGWLDKLGALEYLPERVEQEENGHTNVSSEEISELTGSPLAGMGEDSKAVEEDDQTKVDQGEPSKVWLIRRPEHQSLAINTLRNESLAELDVGNANAAPGEELGNGGEVLEPQKDVVGPG